MFGQITDKLIRLQGHAAWKGVPQTGAGERNGASRDRQPSSRLFQCPSCETVYIAYTKETCGTCGTDITEVR